MEGWKLRENCKEEMKWKVQDGKVKIQGQGGEIEIEGEGEEIKQNDKVEREN